MTSRSRTRGISPAEYARLLKAPVASDPGVLAGDRGSTALQPAARLALSGANRLGPLDGAWWPTSTELTAEVGPLVAAVGEANHSAVIHLTYDRRVWSTTGRRVRVGQRWVKVGWFQLTEPQQVNLSLVDGRTIALLVIPPGTVATQAEWLLAQASDPGNRLRASELLAAAPPAPSAPAPAAAPVAV